MTFVLRTPVFTLALMAALGMVSSAQAEKADRLKPMNVEADKLRYDDLNQTSVFSGNVVVTKGTMVMRGARIDIRQDPEGYQYATVLSGGAGPAYYKQKREGVEETIEAEAEAVEYDGRADRLKFLRGAVLRRYKGALLNDETQGNLITYDNTTDIFTVEGGRPLATASNPGGRVKAMLTPREAASQPAPAGSVPAPAALRQTRQLGGPAETGKQP